MPRTPIGPEGLTETAHVRLSPSDLTEIKAAARELRQPWTTHMRNAALAAAAAQHRVALAGGPEAAKPPNRR